MKKALVHIAAAILPRSAWRKQFRSFFLDSKENLDATRHHIDKTYIEKRESIVQRPVKVVFLISFIDCWEAVKTVYYEMLKDECFEPIIISIPRITKHATIEYNQENFNFFIKQGIDVIKGYDEASKKWFDLEALGPDIVFIQTPHRQKDTLENYDKIFKYALIAYIPYGIMTAKIQQMQFNTPFHHKCWKIFAETSFHKMLYKKYGNIPGKYVVTCGNPKLDIFNNLPTNINDRYWKISKNDNPSIKRILWTPHWSVDNYLNYSNFLEYYPYFLDLVKANPNIEVILKPHPELYEELIRIGKKTKEELEELELEFNALPNASIYKEGDYFELFLSSDAMINDSISFLVEYLPTKKPLLFLDSQRHIGFNEFGEKLISCHYISKTVEQTDQFIYDVVINGNDYMYEARIKVMKSLLYMPEEGAGYLIKEKIKNAFIKQEGMSEQDVSISFWENNTHDYSYETTLEQRANNQKAFGLKYFIPLLDKNSVLLDLGSADGWFDFYLAPFVKSIEAYDINESFIDLAVAKADEAGIDNITFKKDNIINMPLSEKFDFVTVLGVTGYIIEDDNFEKFIKKVATCVNNSGVLLTKEFCSLEEQSFTFFNKEDNYICRYRTFNYYTSTLKKNGFELVAAEPIDIDRNNHTKKADLRMFVFKKIGGA